MEANGLELIQRDSKVIKFDIIEDLQSDIVNNFKEKSFVVAYLDYKVLIGTWENVSFCFYNNNTLKENEKYIQKLRVFNKNKELMVWRTSAGLKGRLRTDKEGTGTEIVVAKQVLFGTEKEKSYNGNFIGITEGRGTTLILPFGDIKFDNDGKLVSRICIKTYNYIGYNALHQATYGDCRFVSFTDGQNNLI